MKEIIQVLGMSCTSCINSIEGSVGKLTGVSSVKVDVSRGEVTVEFDNAQTTLTLIKETIKEQGYNVI